MKKNWFAAMLLLTISAAHGANWVYLTEIGEGTLWIDAQSLRRSGPKAKLWTKWSYATPLKDTFTGKMYQGSKDQYAFDCLNRTLGVIDFVLYENADFGSTIRSWSKADEKLTDAVPDSIGETLLNYACKRK